MTWRKVLITAGSTREPIDAVRFIGNRSSGQMGVALTAAALTQGHEITLVLGVAAVDPPPGAHVERVETTEQMHEAVLRLWPGHDLLVMNAAVADFRPRRASPGKLRRQDGLTLELEPTPDILAAAAAAKRADQRLVGFSLDEDTADARERARAKLARKRIDLIVFNPLATMDASAVAAELYYADGRSERVGLSDKRQFADLLMDRAAGLFSV